MKPVPLARRSSRGGLYAFLGTLLVVLTISLLPALRSTSVFLPHGVCYQWQPNLIRLHLVSDALIGLAYTAIPIVLVHFIRKREDLPFNWMFLLFGVFIVACGATHWMEVWTLWNPDYWLSGAVKAVTAAASVPTAILLYLLLPRALAIPSTRDLQAAKAALEGEVAIRKRAEAELEEARHRLEERVAERTNELQRANATLRQQGERLELAAREKSDFLAILSHEIRNPLHALATSTQVVKLASDAAQRERAFAAMERQVGRLRVLLEGLLDVTRASRPLTVDPQPHDLREVLESAVQTTAGYLAEKSQPLSVSLPQAPVIARSDAGRIEQVVVNLLQNASKFTPENGRVHLRLEVDAEWARVVVEDEGRGMTAEEMPRIFEFFHQGTSASGHTSAEGFGLGLHIVREIVHAHGGRVEAHSHGAGRGSRFTVWLPLETRASDPGGR